jgi:hypothetical protein
MPSIPPLNFKSAAPEAQLKRLNNARRTWKYALFEACSRTRFLSAREIDGVDLSLVMAYELQDEYLRLARLAKVLEDQICEEYDIDLEGRSRFSLAAQPS